MLEIIAVIFIAAGIFMILRGLTEDRHEWYEEWHEQEYRQRYGNYEEYKHGFEDREDEKKRREIKGGGVILIGPIPIVFGESRFAVYALILAIVLMLLSIAFIFMTYGV